MAKDPNSDETNLIESDISPLEEPTLEETTLEDTTLEFDLIANQTEILKTHILSDDQLPIDDQKIEFVQFLRQIKNEEQKIALAELYTDFELILTMQHNIDSLDESDPLGQPTLENSAKKTMLLLDTVTRILNNILRVKPEAHYIKETHRLRRNTNLPVDEYYSVKSPELDLVKAYTNFDQLKMLLVNTMRNRQAFELLDTMNERVLPQYKEFLKGLRRGEAQQDGEDLLGGRSYPDGGSEQRMAQTEAEGLLRQTILSLTNSFLVLQSQIGLPGITNELAINLKDVYRALTDFRRTPAATVIEDKAQVLNKLIEQSLLDLNRTASLPPTRTPEAARYSFLFDVIEYVTQVCGALDGFFEQQTAARLEETYFKRLDLARNTVKHLRNTMKQEHYNEKAELPFLNLKSFVYFAVKVIKDLNYFNPQVKRKHRYYIERNIIDMRLREAFHKIPQENRIERRYTITTLLELNRMLRIVSCISPNKDDRTAYQLTYYSFKLVEQNLRNLIAFLKSYPTGEKLASRFDSMSFTLEVEAERVFGKHGHLVQINEQSPIEEWIKHVEDSVGILGRVLQENYLYIAQLYLPDLARADLDKDYKQRLVSTLMLREHTWCVWQVCALAEQQIKAYIEHQITLELPTFLNWVLRAVQIYLVKFLPKVFYSDRVELRRTYNDLLSCATLLADRKENVTSQHLHQLRERIHLLATLLASLSENIKNRSILEDKPFDQEGAQRTLQKYLQLRMV
jgi:hypothetical protein